MLNTFLTHQHKKLLNGHYSSTIILLLIINLQKMDKSLYQLSYNNVHHINYRSLMLL
jgi:hypothetical protein